MRERGRKRNRIIKTLAHKEWGNSLEVQRALYLQWVRSGLEYAASSWSSWISDTKMLQLERIQREALRSMAGLTKTCPEEFLNLETGVEPLAMRFLKIDEITHEDSDGRQKEEPTKTSKETLQLPQHLPGGTCPTCPSGMSD